MYLVVATWVLGTAAQSGQPSPNNQSSSVPPTSAPSDRWQAPDPDELIDLDFEKRSDGFVVPELGWRWLASGDGGALAVGIGIGAWRRFTPQRSSADIGLSMLWMYEGADGAARGRSLRMVDRLVLGGGPIHLKLGADLGTSRARFDFVEPLDGTLTGGPAADLRIAWNGSGIVFGGNLDYFLVKGRPSQRADSPLAGFCDEFQAYGGVAYDGGLLRYSQWWSAAGPMHMIVSTTLF